MIRWFFVVPAALTGYGIAQLAAILVTAFFPDFVSQLVGSLTSPMGFVLLGARVAPDRKLIVAAVLTVLMILSQGYYVGLISRGVGREYGWVAWASIPLGVIGPTLGVYVVYRQIHRGQP